MTPGMFDDAWKAFALVLALIVAGAFLLGRGTAGCELHVIVTHPDGGAR